MVTEMTGAETKVVCPDCGGTGLTGEQVYERLSNEGGIYLDVLCPTCQDVDEGEAVLHVE